MVLCALLCAAGRAPAPPEFESWIRESIRTPAEVLGSSCRKVEEGGGRGQVSGAAADRFPINPPSIPLLSFGDIQMTSVIFLTNLTQIIRTECISAAQ